jgi:hypothetical protein
VPRLFDEFLDEHTALTEVTGRKPLDRMERSRQFLRTPTELHADASTARGALQHHRIADINGSSRRVLDISQQPATW